MLPKVDIWQGTLALMILRTLETIGSMHGYGIARRIEQTSDHRLVINYGTLYPQLIKLEQDGSIAGAWGTSDTGRRAKYYRLTPAGCRRLVAMVAAWEEARGIVARFVAPEGRS